MSLFKVMVRALASHPDPFAVLVQQDGNRRDRAGEEQEKSARPADPEVARRDSGGEGNPALNMKRIRLIRASTLAA